jgi:hypothetical protein
MASSSKVTSAEYWQYIENKPALRRLHYNNPAVVLRKTLSIF